MPSARGPYQSNANILQGDDAKVYREARAGDLYRRREVQPWVHHRKASTSKAVLPAHAVSKRGDARKLMAYAFITEVVERVQNEDWAVLTALIDAKLARL